MASVLPLISLLLELLLARTQFFLEALRMPARLSSTLDQHLVCPIVTPSPTFVQRDGNLSVLEEEGIAEASEFEFWSSKMKDFPIYHVTVVLFSFFLCR